MRKTITTAIALLIAAMGFAQEPDALYKIVKHEWTVNADGTSDYHYRHEVKILRNHALTNYADKGETFVVYNPDLEELTVNEVYTIQADGKRVDMPQNAFIYQLPSECADCGRFNHIRELAMVHTGMEIGCTIVVDYTIHSQYGVLNRTLPLMRECPIETLVVNINLPEDQELGIKLNKGYSDIDFGHLDVNQTEHSYSLRGTNMKQTFTDAYLPDDIYPTLHFYNGTPQWTPALDENEFHGAHAAMGLTMTTTDQHKNLVAARNFVVENIHLNDIPAEHLAYTHATPTETWQSGCGTATDKAVLLAAILRDEGFRASVTGEHADQVSVMLDTLEYRLAVRRTKNPMTLYGEAKDEVVKQDIKTTTEASMLTLSDGFFHVLLPQVPGSPKVEATRLALTRTSPVQSQACSLKSDVTINLPKGLTMVGSKVNRKVSYDSIGSVVISIKQSGKKLKVQRELTLDQSVVAPKDYAHYRELLTIWQSYDKVLMRSK